MVVEVPEPVEGPTDIMTVLRYFDKLSTQQLALIQWITEQDDVVLRDGAAA